MLNLPDSWIWDFWIADTGSLYHVFFLRASRALRDPDRRHRRAGVGHAISTDLRDWTLTADALVAADAPRWDDLAIWTGSVVQGADRVWRTFYTGIAEAERGQVQRIGVATSTDLLEWATRPDPVLTADGRWYETRATSLDGAEFWRDPWVFADPDGLGWHMLVTARGGHGAAEERGVVGHARSENLEDWTVLPPLSAPGSGFGQQEVTQTAVVDGRPVLIFSCLAGELAARHRTAHGTGGCWYLPCETFTGPFDMSRARLLLDDRFYAARLVQDRDGAWQLLAFHNRASDGAFIGRLSDPMRVHWSGTGELLVG